MVRVPAHLRALLCAQGQEEGAIVFLHLSSLRFAGPCQSRCRATWPPSGYRGFDFQSVRPCPSAARLFDIKAKPGQSEPDLLAVSAASLMGISVCPSLRG